MYTSRIFLSKLVQDDPFAEDINISDCLFYRCYSKLPGSAISLNINNKTNLHLSHSTFKECSGSHALKIETRGHSQSSTIYHCCFELNNCTLLESTGVPFDINNSKISQCFCPNSMLKTDMKLYMTNSSYNNVKSIFFGIFTKSNGLFLNYENNTQEKVLSVGIESAMEIRSSNFINIDSPIVSYGDVLFIDCAFFNIANVSFNNHSYFENCVVDLESNITLPDGIIAKKNIIFYEIEDFVCLSKVVTGKSIYGNQYETLSFGSGVSGVQICDAIFNNFRLADDQPSIIEFNYISISFDLTQTIFSNNILFNTNGIIHCFLSLSEMYVSKCCFFENSGLKTVIMKVSSQNANITHTTFNRNNLIYNSIGNSDSLIYSEINNPILTADSNISDNGYRSPEPTFSIFSTDMSSFSRCNFHGGVCSICINNYGLVENIIQKCIFNEVNTSDATIYITYYEYFTYVKECAAFGPFAIKKDSPVIFDKCNINMLYLIEGEEWKITSMPGINYSLVLQLPLVTCYGEKVPKSINLSLIVSLSCLGGILILSLLVVFVLYFSRLRREHHRYAARISLQKDVIEDFG